MLKYSIASDEGSFSPSHRQDNHETATYMKDTIDNNNNTRARTKMVMKKRAKHVQKRTNEYSMLPPISGPQNFRKEIMTPYINTAGTTHELESPYTNALGISRLHDVTTPYIMNSHFSKMEAVSPIPGRDYAVPGREFTKLSNMQHGSNVVDVGRIRNEPSFVQETVSKMQQSSSPYIERKTRYERKNSHKYLTEKIEFERNGKLQVHSNQMGLLERRRNRGNETFSIRKKIEQFRRWHEEQYKEKLKKLKEEIDNQFENDQHQRTRKSAVHTKRETKDISGEKAGESKENKENGENDSRPKTGKEPKIPKESRQQEESISTGEKQSMDVGDGEGHIADNKSVSEHTWHTWHTWRDVNDSYAYNDVNKYILDNELMSPEKVDWIKDWVIDVAKAFAEPDKNDEEDLL